MSRLRVEPVTQALAQSAATLLHQAGLHGHKHAIDAMLCATALAGLSAARPYRPVTGAGSGQESVATAM